MVSVISFPNRSMLSSALGGEIDIFEGVNMQNSNQMTIHSGPGCTMPHDLSQTGAQTGTALGTDCASSPSNNAGCGVMERTTNSYGKGFADNKGGVWVTQFDTSGIRIWFVPVSDGMCETTSHILQKISGHRYLQRVSLPIPANSGPRRLPSLRPTAILPPFLQSK